MTSVSPSATRASVSDFARRARRLRRSGVTLSITTPSGAICGVTLSVSVVAPDDRRLVVERQSAAALCERRRPSPARPARLMKRRRSVTRSPVSDRRPARAPAWAPRAEARRPCTRPVDAGVLRRSARPRRSARRICDLPVDAVLRRPRDRAPTRSRRSGKSVTCSRPALRSRLKRRALGQQRLDALREIREEVRVVRSSSRRRASCGRLDRRPPSVDAAAAFGRDVVDVEDARLGLAARTRG